jgi:hypothetical protein
MRNEKDKDRVVKSEARKRTKEETNIGGHSDLKKRTKEFALRIIELVETLPRGRTADVVGGQLLRWAHQLVPIIALLAEPDPRLTSLQ